MKNKKLSKSVIYNMSGSIIYLFMQWLIIYVILWTCGYKKEGMFSAVMSLSAVFYAFSLFGMRNYQSTDLNCEHSEKTYILSRLLTCLISLLLSIVYCLIFKYKFYMILCINFYLLFKFSESIIDVLHGSLQREWKFKQIGISFISRGIITLIVFSISLLLFKSLLASIILMALSSYIFIYFYDYKIYKKVFKNIGDATKKSIFKLLLLCFPLALYTTISNYALSYPKLLISKIFGSKILGYYTTYANPAMIVQVAASFLVSPLITYFAELYKNEDTKNILKILLKCFIIITIIGVVAILFCTLFGRKLFAILFGKEIIKYYYLLNQMIVISVLTALMWLLAGIITMLRKFKPLIYINAFYILIVIIGCNLVIKSYQLTGVNYAIIISMIIVIILYYVYILLFLKGKGRRSNEKISSNK